MIPSWVQTLDAAIEGSADITVRCTVCGGQRPVDLVALREKVGGSYSLVNRRCRCRFTAGCPGWNVFDYLHGVRRPLRDPETFAKWMVQDWMADPANPENGG